MTPEQNLPSCPLTSGTSDSSLEATLAPAMRTLDPRLAEANYVVKADSFAQRNLWRQHSGESPYSYIYRQTPKLFGPRESAFYEIGTLDGRPVTLALTWQRVGHCNVMFYNSPSEVVDQRMVNDWLTENCPAFSTSRCVAGDFWNFSESTHHGEKRAERVTKRKEIDPLLSSAEFIVEADLFAQRELFREWAAGSPDSGRFAQERDVRGQFRWDINKVVEYEIGSVAGRPVTLELSCNKIGIHEVIFYRPTSEVVDHEMVKGWLKEHCPAFSTHHCDARNFDDFVNYQADATRARIEAVEQRIAAGK